jgi:hypothetical protein
MKIDIVNPMPHTQPAPARMPPREARRKVGPASAHDGRRREHDADRLASDEAERNAEAYRPKQGILADAEGYARVREREQRQHQIRRPWLQITLETLRKRQEPLDDSLECAHAFLVMTHPARDLAGVPRGCGKPRCSDSADPPPPKGCGLG